MIRKIRSRLSVKVFLLTSLLMAACCAATYSCIARFAPYIYAHELSEAEEIAGLLAAELSGAPLEEAPYFIPAYADILRRDYDDEFVFHLFRSSGEEVALPGLDSLTGTRRDDYARAEKTRDYPVSFADSAEAYVLFITKNTNKESQVIEALQKALPLLAASIVAMSVISACFYTAYMTRPIKKLSRLSVRMAAMDFSGLCPTARTDEIGVLSHSLHDLSQKLLTALSELQAANQALQADIDRERQLEKQRAAFFSAASHELKTPITIIKGQLQGMLYEVGRYKDRETYLAQALEVTGVLENLVQELLTLSRLDTPGYACQKNRLDLSQFLSERLSAYDDLFLQNGLTVQKAIAPGIAVSADRHLLQKAVDNLLSNAAAYSPAENRVLVTLGQDAGGVTLTIENTGAHIPDADMPKLFEAFYRVDPSRSRQTGGTGLGLYIAKTILDLHGADMAIANTPQGVAVSVRF